jgi:hypothetical protein
MARDLVAHPENWENVTLESFLHAMSSFIGSIESWAANTGRPRPVQLDWNLLGEILMIAREYE